MFETAVSGIIITKNRCGRISEGCIEAIGADRNGLFESCAEGVVDLVEVFKTAA